ncbi:MAG: DUF4397 domain-containing protein [Bacteroidota bacterium]
MKKLFSSMRISMLAIGAALSVVLLLSSCKKSDTTGNDIQVAGLMAFNLAVDKPGITITLSNNALIQGSIPYTGYTGGYYNIYPGNRTVQAFDITNTGTSITNSTHTFDAKKYYSLFVVGANNVYSNVVVLDNYDSLSATNGQAYVRFINAIPDSSNPRVNITANSTTVYDAPAHYATVSQFTQVAPGQITISTSNDGSIQTSRTITVEQKKAYTILLIGKPGETDAARAVQIKFIENGTLTP